VVNVSNPAAPFEVGYVDTPDVAHGVAVAGSYAYVADEDAGLRVVNVSDPAAPVEVGFYDTPGWASRVAVAGGYVHLAAALDGGLYVFRECGGVVFSDGFESGDTSAWSATVP
jgi:hypothetical protein